MRRHYIEGIDNAIQDKTLHTLAHTHPRMPRHTGRVPPTAGRHRYHPPLLARCLDSSSAPPLPVMIKPLFHSNTPITYVKYTRHSLHPLCPHTHSSIRPHTRRPIHRPA